MWDNEHKYNEEETTTPLRQAVGNDGAGLEYRESWWEQARCATHPAKEVFAAEAGARVEIALACCRMCPVIGPCRTDALRYPSTEQHGTVGGMTAHERRRTLRALERSTGGRS